MGCLERFLPLPIPPHISRVSKIRTSLQVFEEGRFVNQLSTGYVHKYRILLHRGKFVGADDLVGELCLGERDYDGIALRLERQESLVALKRSYPLLSYRFS